MELRETGQTPASLGAGSLGAPQTPRLVGAPCSPSWWEQLSTFAESPFFLSLSTLAGIGNLFSAQ